LADGEVSSKVRSVVWARKPEVPLGPSFRPAAHITQYNRASCDHRHKQRSEQPAIPNPNGVAEHLRSQGIAKANLGEYETDDKQNDRNQEWNGHGEIFALKQIVGWTDFVALKDWIRVPTLVEIHVHESQIMEA
jgi:hypothetical protein